MWQTNEQTWSETRLQTSLAAACSLVPFKFGIFVKLRISNFGFIFSSLHNVISAVSQWRALKQIDFFLATACYSKKRGTDKHMTRPGQPKCFNYSLPPLMLIHVMLFREHHSIINHIKCCFHQETNIIIIIKIMKHSPQCSTSRLYISKIHSVLFFIFFLFSFSYGAPVPVYTVSLLIMMQGCLEIYGGLSGFWSCVST